MFATPLFFMRTSLEFHLNLSFLRQRLNHALIEEGYDINHDRYPEGYQEAPLAYDAVWSVALAFNKTMERLKQRNKSLKEFTYNDKEIADEIYAAMNSTQFLGVSVSEYDFKVCLLPTEMAFSYPLGFRLKCEYELVLNLP